MTHYQNPARVNVLGLAMHPATKQETSLRLEEMVYHVTHSALENARVSRPQVDGLVLASADELDGRPISSMLMVAPAGGYLVDEIKLTDCGASALCMAYARIASGDFDLVLASSWCKSSKTDVESVMRLRADPFYSRPLGLGATIADGLYAQANMAALGISEAEVGERVNRASRSATRNPRGTQAPELAVGEIGHSAYDATPVRTLHRAPLTDGAVTIVLASDQFLRANRHCRPIACVSGVSWATDRYALGWERLTAHRSARAAWKMLMRQTGLSSAADFNLIELEAQTGWYEAALSRAIGLDERTAISPSGGAWAQNPLFCTGLVNAAEAILQVAGSAGEVQLQNVRRSVAHSMHGFAQQGHVFMAFEKPGSPQ